MWANVTFVAMGGALGAALRYLVGVGVFHLFGRTGFPLGIISVNVVGSFLMGAFVVLAAQRGLTAYAPFVMTGLLGGFTTFSAFSLETVTLIERGEMINAALYVGLSVVLSVGGLFLAMTVLRWALA